MFIVTAGMTALNFLVQRRPPETHAAPAGAPGPRFLDRLPMKLRGAELYAVEAEDHYLRLHTARGQDLILMRLSGSQDLFWPKGRGSSSRFIPGTLFTNRMLAGCASDYRPRMMWRGRVPKFMPRRSDCGPMPALKASSYNR